MSKETLKMSVKEWLEKGTKLFGENKKKWKFKCPVCGNIQTYEDFEKIGVENPENVVSFSCIGRWLPEDKCSTMMSDKIKPPCNYTNGGLFNLTKLIVIDEEGKGHSVFEFDE